VGYINVHTLIDGSGNARVRKGCFQKFGTENLDSGELRSGQPAVTTKIWLLRINTVTPPILALVVYCTVSTYNMRLVETHS